MKKQLLGPFKQLLTMRYLPLKGALSDRQLEIISHGALYIENEKIVEVGDYQYLREKYLDAEQEVVKHDAVCIPSYVDCHTHIAFSGNRANDFALRNGGSSYLEIANAGGGIWSTVQHTRACSEKELIALVVGRA